MVGVRGKEKGGRKTRGGEGGKEGRGGRRKKKRGKGGRGGGGRGVESKWSPQEGFKASLYVLLAWLNIIRF